MDKVLLISSAPPSWAPLTDITWRTHKRYADAQGYGFTTDVSNIEVPARSPRIHERLTGNVGIAGFRKLDLMLHYLDPEASRQEWDYVVWVDADVLFTRFDEPLNRWLSTDGLSMPYDANGINATVIGAANARWVRDLFWAANNAGRSRFLLDDWREMEALRYFMQTPPYAGRTFFYPVNETCAMPPDVYPIPAITRKQYEWTPESLAVHFSALSLELRVQMAQEWVNRLELLP